MIINDENFKNVVDLIDKIDIDTEEDEGKNRRIEKLQIEIRKMSLEGKSVQRSGNKKRIDQFNRKYLELMSELSRLVQTTGNVNRDEVAKVVRQIKAQ